MFIKTVSMIHVLVFLDTDSIIRGEHPMEPTKSGNPPVHFMRQMIQNKFMLLTVVLAVCAAAYFAVGLFMLLSH